MKMKLLPAGTVLLMTLLVTGCESDNGVAVRRQEKSATYTSLKTWQKRLIDEGAISQGFSPEMVYIAMGNPTKIETKDSPKGHAELWTYSQYYPHVDAVHGLKHQEFTTESAYQPQRATTMAADQSNPNDPFGKQVPVGTALMNPSQFKTGGAQGGSMEPATLRSYTIKVLFASSKVVQISADENMN